jgi:hypothetical protein
MATTSKALFRGAAATSSTTLYTTPSATTTIVTEIVVTNTSASSATFTITLNAVAIASGTSVGANDSTVIQIKQPITATQIIAGFASATTVNFHIAGVEVA